MPDLQWDHAPSYRLSRFLEPLDVKSPFSPLTRASGVCHSPGMGVYWGGMLEFVRFEWWNLYNIGLGEGHGTTLSFLAHYETMKSNRNRYRLGFQMRIFHHLSEGGRDGVGPINSRLAYMIGLTWTYREFLSSFGQSLLMCR